MTPAILIVDDSLTVRMDLDEAFTGAGFMTTSCGSLASARQALSCTCFAAVVLDVLLPDGDGFALMAEIRADRITAMVPVLMLSSEAEVRDRIRGLTTGADEYVGKPYDPVLVVARARRLISTRAAAAQAGAGAPTPAPLPAAAPVAHRILVIDDSPTFRSALDAALREAGFATLIAASGEEGLRLAAQVRPSAVVVDGELPGIAGTDVIRRIRLDHALRLTTCVLLTGSLGAHAELQALEAGADAYLSKEQEFSLVVARIATLVRGAAELPAPELASSLGHQRVMAVDDSPTHLHHLSEQLHDEGYEIITARSGEEALALLALQPVDCILLDLVMPGLSGEETCRRIKQSPALRDIPLLIMSASDAQEALVRSIDAGADDCLVKGMDLAVLKARLRAQLRRKQSHEESRTIREQRLRRELQAAEMRAAQELAQTRASLLADLERRFQELEAFSYSASHDLRAPLRSITGFSRVLIEDHGGSLGPDGCACLERVGNAAQQMSQLIEALLNLSRVSRGELTCEVTDISAVAHEIVTQLRQDEPARSVEVRIAPGLQARGDARLLRIVLANLIGNAWKYTAKREQACIEIGALREGTCGALMVRDNGAGFPMALASKLFSPFQRLHSSAEYEGTGIGLATVQRIIQRHNGRIWAEAEVGRGATFFVVLPASDGAAIPATSESAPA